MLCYIIVIGMWSVYTCYMNNDYNCGISLKVVLNIGMSSVNLIAVNKSEHLYGKKYINV